MTDHRPLWAKRLQAEREARGSQPNGWSKREMARQLLRAAGHEHGSVDNLARQIRDWERGLHFPRDWADAYARAFGLARGDLFPEREDDEVKRRTMLGLIAAAAAGPLGRDAEPLRTTLDDAVHAEATERDADAWERVAFDYAHEVDSVSNALLLPELLTDFTEISALIGRASGLTRQRLVHAAAQMAALTAITLMGLGEQRSARRWWRTAGRAADESGDQAVASQVRGRQAVFSLYGDAPTLSTLDIADEAIRLSRGMACAGAASGHAARAQALAQLGRHQEASGALTDLEDVFVCLPDRTRDDRASQWGWSEQRLHHVASYVHTFAGDAEKAGRAQDLAIALYPERSHLGRAQVELHRAGCLLRAGDAEEGARHVVRVFQEIPAELSGNVVVRRTAFTSLGLAPPADSGRTAVRDAHELLAATTSGDL
ncbi:hypothetical protein [Actinomadura xylanilytica]|uniref:hypothetical protein n=1 Tax=Actinomadura xylanilytica TaxID=887459 RepID=UPI00255A8692|nr:hypothetical protein [Actinomadura xylanilytica]MDL4775868.1 hypothetical protein [Actinomadura xylanilytica]